MRSPRYGRRGKAERRSAVLLSQGLVGAFNLDGFLAQSASILKDNLDGVDAIIVYIYDPYKRQLVPVSVSGCKQEHVDGVRIEDSVKAVTHVFTSGRPLLQAEEEVSRTLAEFLDPGYAQSCRFKNLFSVPITLSDGTPIGCLLFLSALSKGFTPRNLLFLRRTAKILGPFIYKAQTLRQSQEKKFSNLVCTLSHELRTPLTCIKGYATTLLGDGANEQWSREERYEFLKIIDAETDTMKELIDDLMDSSMIESGLLSIKKEPVLLSRIVAKAVDDARMRSAKHKFVVSIPRALPVIEADPVRTRQVLDNLLNNAIKYSPNGGLIVIQCSIGSKEVTLSVADEGMGIAPEHLNRLFEKFYRVKSNLAGTGLGLPVACEIVEKQGGRIWARSTPGRGSTFYFTLPLTETGYFRADEEAGE